MSIPSYQMGARCLVFDKCWRYRALQQVQFHCKAHIDLSMFLHSHIILAQYILSLRTFFYIISYVVPVTILANT